jgi:uncharacterized protein YecE (DUF72 family)
LAVAIKVGTSGWSYPSWRPGFYPEGLQPVEFLGFYARRFDTVELNSTGYRLPSADQFRRWADAVPDGFEFSVKLPLVRLDRVTSFLERVLALGDRLGPVRIVYEGPRDDGTLSFVQGSLPEDVRVAWDFRDESWGKVEGVVRVNDPEAEPFRYLRLREPPYSDDDLRTVAASVRDPAYVYLRHEDLPTAPATAERLRMLLP